MFCFSGHTLYVPLFCKTDHIPAVFSKNGAFSIQFVLGMGRSNVVRICFGVDRFHIVVCQHDKAQPDDILRTTQIAGNLYPHPGSVDCKNGQCIVFLIPDADRIEIRSLPYVLVLS